MDYLPSLADHPLPKTNDQAPIDSILHRAPEPEKVIAMLEEPK